MDDQNQGAGAPFNLHEYETAARTLLPPMVFDFIAGGSGDEATLRANRAAFARWVFLPRVMRDVPAASTATTVLGVPVSLPVVVAPTSLHRLVCAAGECATARAADAAGTIYTMSMAASTTIEEVGAVAGTWWFQLYILQDRSRTRELVERAAAAGASAIVVTVDLARPGRREADERNQFTLPDGIAFANLDVSGAGRVPVYRATASVLAGQSTTTESGLTWTDLRWLASITTLPIVVKGVLHPLDAVSALDHGASALVVSNHGGRQLDSAIAALDALPAVVEAVQGRAEVYLDGGVRRGTDVLKALALGARAVMIGRPILWGLAVDGEAGAHRVLELLRHELETDLMLCGLAGPAEATRSLLVGHASV